MSVHRTTRAVVLEELTRPNALFLSVASRANFIEPLPVYEWFRSGLKFMDPIRGAAALAEAVAELLESSPQLYRQLVNLLRFADVGISELLIGTTLGLGAAQDSPGHMEMKADQIPRPWTFDLGAAAKALEKRVAFRHSSSERPVEVADESDGTRAWLDLLRVALVALEDGDVLVVDEIDTSRHPALTSRLLALERRYLGGSYGAVPKVRGEDFADAVQDADDQA
jgi:hypothetical protein